ncbi:MAG: patatin-like phospholipase family protein [Desulfobacca sp.]|nr:patatin-like phospholipase family protein [Desulfobacca sp.]
MKKLLAIDGGGIRGIIPALILAEIEGRTNRNIASLFDLMAGTSTGGIIALALSRDNGHGSPQYSASDLVELYENRGREIFSRSFWQGISSVGGVSDQKYSHKPLEAILKEYLDDEPLGAALTKVLISSYEIQLRKPFFFKSWRPETRSILMRQVGRATSAAPTYFEPALVAVEGSTLALVDGGVYVNNPAMSAYAEARRLFPEEDALVIVSLGTGELTRPISYNEAKDWGLMQWAIPILNVVFDGVSDAVDYQLRQILGDKFFRFQTRLDTANDDMDDASSANLLALKKEAELTIKTQQADIAAVCDLLLAQT